MVKILWVDDEVELLKPHVLFLQQKGYEVDTCNNGYDAIDPEYFDHTVIGFRICKINVFIIKRKNPAVYWPVGRLNATFTPKKTK